MTVHFVDTPFLNKDTIVMAPYFRYLAHDMEEDEEELKYEVFPWILGRRWRKTYPTLLQRRDEIYWAIDCRAVVSKKCCDQVI